MHTNIPILQGVYYLHYVDIKKQAVTLPQVPQLKKIFFFLKLQFLHRVSSVFSSVVYPLVTIPSHLTLGSLIHLKLQLKNWREVNSPSSLSSKVPKVSFAPKLIQEASP